MTSIVTRQIQPIDPRTTYSRGGFTQGESSTKMGRSGPQLSRKLLGYEYGRCRAFREEILTCFWDEIPVLSGCKALKGCCKRLVPCQKSPGKIRVRCSFGSKKGRLKIGYPKIRRFIIIVVPKKKKQSGNTSCHLHRNIVIIYIYNYC